MKLSKTLVHKDQSVLPFFMNILDVTVSSFKGIGRKTAWNVRMPFDNVTDAFGYILQEKDISQDCFAVLEHFTALLHDRIRTAKSE